MTRFDGTVRSVQTRTIGSTVTATATASTTLVVDNASWAAGDTGQILVEGVVVDFTEVLWGDTSDTFILSAPVTVAEGLWVEAYPVSYETVAWVLPDGSEDQIIVRVDQALALHLPVGDRVAEDARERVAVDDSAGALRVVDVYDQDRELLVGDVNDVHILIKGNELAVYRPGGTNPDGSTNPPQKMTVLGGDTGGAFEAFDADGPLGGVKSNGNFIGPEVHAERIFLQGEELTRVPPNTKMELMGRGYVGDTHLDVVVPSVVAGITVNKPFKAGRLYKVAIQFGARPASNTSWAAANCCYDTGSLTNSSPTLGGTKYIASGQNTVIAERFMEWEFIPSSDTSRMRFGLKWDNTSSGNVDSRWYRFWVYDCGIAPDDTAFNVYSGPPPATDFEHTEYFATHHGYTQYGPVQDPWGPSWVRHGTGGSSFYRTYLPIPADARTKIINSVATPRVFTKLRWGRDNEGIDPWVGTTTATTFGSSDSGITIANATQAGASYQDGSHKEFEWSAAMVTAVRTGGARALVIGRKSSAPLVGFYGTSAGGSAPRIRVTGTE